MSVLDLFVSRYAGQQIKDNSGQFPGECLSLVKRYAQEVQGVPNADSVLFAINGAAKDLWQRPTDLTLQYYDKVSSPQAGDIAVYTNGTYGDVAVYLGNGQVFGQLGTPVFQPAAVRNVGSPTGYLRLKGSDVSDTIETLQSAINSLTNTVEVLQSALNSSRHDDEVHLSALNAARAQVSDLQAQLAAAGKNSDFTPYTGDPLFVKKK
jgi:hypothetical protein